MTIEENDENITKKKRKTEKRQPLQGIENINVDRSKPFRDMVRHSTPLPSAFRVYSNQADNSIISHVSNSVCEDESDDDFEDSSSFMHRRREV